MGRRFDTITFLSDYGLADEFVGVVKAVVADIAPAARVIDLTHGIAPFDVRGGSLALARAVPYLPVGVILAVVDPGVGTSRRAVGVEVAGGDGVFVGPDNGLLAPSVALAGGAERAVVLSNDAYQLPTPGATFAGRDVFAPAAAHLCNGVDLGELGEPIDPDLLLPAVIGLPRIEGDALVAEVLWVDHFGNCQLNVGPDDLLELAGRLPERVRLSLTDAAGAATVRSAALAASYGELGAGAVGLVLDSSGMYAVCLERASAAAELHLGVGDLAVITLHDDVAPGADRVVGTTTPVRLRPGPGPGPALA